jgi:hypothetical protein
VSRNRALDPSGEKLIASEVQFGATKSKQSMEGMKGMDNK